MTHLLLPNTDPLRPIGGDRLLASITLCTYYIVSPDKCSRAVKHAVCTVKANLKYT